MVELPDGAPPRRQASSEMRNLSVILSWPAFSFSNTMSIVMTLLMLAGCIGSSGCFSNRTFPDRLSIMMACVALVSKSSATDSWCEDKQHCAYAQHKPRHCKWQDRQLHLHYREVHVVWAAFIAT
jgi:hypothetical protein